MLDLVKSKLLARKIICSNHIFTKKFHCLNCIKVLRIKQSLFKYFVIFYFKLVQF